MRPTAFGMTTNPLGMLRGVATVIRPWRAALVAGVGAVGLIAAETPDASAVTGTISEFSVTTAFSGADKITAGPDGNLWFTEMVANKIGRITTAGVVTEFPVTRMAPIEEL